MPKVRRVPERTCVACGRVRPKRELVRIVRTPNGEIKVDLTGKVSGRGAYVCPEPPCAERGVKEGRLQHALETPVPEMLVEDLRKAVAVAAAGRR
ncbi:MAG TPA: YlxR family protein [bacterium]|nr:YlxR family protein [bacterium]